MHHGIGPFQKWKGLTRFGNFSKKGSLPGLITGYLSLVLKVKFNSFKTGGWRCYNPQGFSIATFERSTLSVNPDYSI